MTLFEVTVKAICGSLISFGESKLFRSEDRLPAVGDELKFPLGTYKVLGVRQMTQAEVKAWAEEEEYDNWLEQHYES